MPTYVALCQWTQKGIENVRQSPERLDKFKEMVRSAGGQFKSFYLTMGQYDFVAVFEMKDDVAAAKLALQVGAGGHARTETLKAFEETEYRQLLGSM
jgi:uncharacterized protein with GYD domain